MHLRTLEIYCDVVRHHSFSKAADARGISQPQASQAVHLLEAHLDVKLIDRSTRPFHLTPAGEMYFDGCVKVLEQFRSLEDRVQRTADRVIGRVRIAAIYSVGFLQMNDYVKRFRELYPDVAVDIAYLHPDEVYSRVQRDQADIGLVSFPRETADLDSVLWQAQQMVVAVSSEHPFAERDSITVSELDGIDFVAFTPELRIRQMSDEWFQQAGVAVNEVHRFDNIETIKRAVEIGSGVALLPAVSVAREVGFGMLKTVEVEGQDWARELCIVHLRNRPLVAAAEKFVEVLHEEFTTNRDVTEVVGRSA